MCINIILETNIVVKLVVNKCLFMFYDNFYKIQTFEWSAVVSVFISVVGSVVSLYSVLNNFTFVLKWFKESFKG